MPWVSFEDAAQLDGFAKRLEENNVPYFKSKLMNKDGISVFSSEKSASLLSRHIRDFYEDRMIQYIYYRRYRRFSKDFDDERVCEISKKLASDDIMLEKTMSSEILQLMGETENLFVKGITDFRLKRYKDILEENIGKGIESYTREREAESFIDLLKYFVSIQEPQYRLVHVINEQDIYSIIDEQYQEISYFNVAEIQEQAFEDISSGEDWVLSVLITVAPQRIVFHNSNHQTPKNFLDTLEKVFEKRFKICDGCSFCRKNLLKS